MASQAHCAFCFETLSASFERRQALSLGEVEELWAQYHAARKNQPFEVDDDESEDVEDDEDAEMTDADVEEPQAPRPAAISRLLNRDTSAASSSSSLPSTRSAASSTQSQRDGTSGTETPASSSSSIKSRSSLFSFGRKRRDRREEHPLFITWNTVSRSGYKSLRGCIGTFEAQELENGLRSYALTSAFEDVRFQPIPSTLLPSLSNHVTLLTNFSQPSKDPMDWTLGKHGLRISFTLNSRRYGATYLPDVAKEQGWTKEETLVSLMQKAGWRGSHREWAKTWRDGKGELIRYEGKQVGLHYAEWKVWRDWVHAEGVKRKPLN